MVGNHSEAAPFAYFAILRTRCIVNSNQFCFKILYSKFPNLSRFDEEVLLLKQRVTDYFFVYSCFDFILLFYI